MTITVGPYTFDKAKYFAEDDILYLGQSGVGEVSPEGHSIDYPDDTSDEVVGMMVLNPRLLLERDGRLPITLPDGTVAESPDIPPLVGHQPRPGDLAEPRRGTAVPRSTLAPP